MAGNEGMLPVRRGADRTAIMAPCSAVTVG